MGCLQSKEENVISSSNEDLVLLNDRKKKTNIECDLVSLGGYSRSPLNVDHDPVTRYTGNEMQAIYEVIYSKDWEAATVLLNDKRFTKYLTHLDRNGRTCLHWACMKKAPLSIIQLLLLEYTDALLQVDAFGQTPIHSAVEHCSQEVISIMLKKKKKSIIKSSSFEKNKSGSIPPLTLALLCERNPTIIKLLLLHDPMQVRFVEDNNKENQNGGVPIEIFFRRHLRNIIGYSHNIDPVTGFSNLVVSHDTVIQEIYMIASYMLQAVIYTEPLMVQTDNHHIQKRQKDFVIVDSWNILPAAIECPQCPHQFVDLILRLHPEQATYLDETKKSPLHLACSLTSKSTSIFNNINNIQFEMNDATNYEDSKTGTYMYKYSSSVSLHILFFWSKKAYDQNDSC